MGKTTTGWGEGGLQEKSEYSEKSSLPHTFSLKHIADHGEVVHACITVKKKKKKSKKKTKLNGIGNSSRTIIIVCMLNISSDHMSLAFGFH